MAKLIGAAKKVKMALLEQKASVNPTDENYSVVANYCDGGLKMTSAIENDETLTFVKVKADKNIETPEKLTFKAFNTANKVTMVDEAGNDVVLIRTARGKKCPKEVSNYFRVSNTTAVYAIEA